MEYKSADRRIRKTEKQLRWGLAKLLQNKSANDITVKELTDLIDINRGTFYLHYKDIFDMIKQIETEMFENFKDVMVRHPVNSMKGKFLPLLIDVFYFIAENSDMCEILLGKNGDIKFVSQLEDLIKERILYKWLKIPVLPDSDDEYFFSFMVSGCIGLFREWLKNGMKETPEQMAVVTERIIMAGWKGIRQESPPSCS